MHSPQLDVIASYGTELLDWLETYTFPAERRYADEQVARSGAALFCDALLQPAPPARWCFRPCTRSASTRCSAPPPQRGMRMIAGKVLMDRNAPDVLRDDVTQAERDCIDLIDRWHGRERLSYAVTVRFAPTSTPEQLAMAGALVQGRPEPVHADPRGREPRRGEMGGRAVSARRAATSTSMRAPACCIRAACWRTASGSTMPTAPRCATVGAQIAHSPSSNLFLGSGLFDWRATEDAGAAVSIATDVGGGTGLSMLRTLGDAYKVQAMRGQRLTAWKGLHAATLGAAEALGLDDEIGSFEPGRSADVCAWDLAVGPVARSGCRWRAACMSGSSPG